MLTDHESVGSLQYLMPRLTVIPITELPNHFTGICIIRPAIFHWRGLPSLPLSLSLPLEGNSQSRKLVTRISDQTSAQNGGIPYRTPARTRPIFACHSLFPPRPVAHPTLHRSFSMLTCSTKSLRQSRSAFATVLWMPGRVSFTERSTTLKQTPAEESTWILSTFLRHNPPKSQPPKSSGLPDVGSSNTTHHHL